MSEKKPTRLIIFEKGMELFAEKGYNGTSMDDIAKAVGIRKATLYSHMPGKESIFITIFDQIVEGYMVFLEKLTAIDESQPAGRKLYKVFYKYVHYNRSNVGMKFWDRFYYFPPEPLKEYIYEKTGDTAAYLQNRIAAIIEKGVLKEELQCNDAVKTSKTFCYLLIGFVLSTTYEDRDVNEDIDSCVSVFLSGLKV